MPQQSHSPSWDEIDRAEAAIALRAHRWSLPLNPEDGEAITVSVLQAARSSRTREQIYGDTQAIIEAHERGDRSHEQNALICRTRRERLVHESSVLPMWQPRNMAGDLVIQLRRIGERRTWPLRRLRSVYEIVIHDGAAEIYRSKTIAPSSVLVAKGKVHTTDSYDWIRAADATYARNDDAWISDPFGGHSLSGEADFRGPWCVTCCLPRLDLELGSEDRLKGRAKCPHCGDTEVEWTD